MSVPYPSQAAGGAPMRSTLESAALPRRVQRTLDVLLALLSEELSRRLERTLVDYEDQLFRLAEQARNPTIQSGHFETLRRVRVNRADVVPRYLYELERVLSQIRVPVEKPLEVYRPVTGFGSLRLVEDEEVTETGQIRAIAVRHEARCSLQLLLLGQRFGVLAGAPALEAEHLPVGPQRFSEIFAEASRMLQISQEARSMLLREFDTHVMGQYAHIADAMNALLAREGILPHLAYVPLRTRAASQQATAQAATRSQPLPTQRIAMPQADERAPDKRPLTSWMGETEPGDEEDNGNVAFSLLQQLMAGRHDLPANLRPNAPVRPQMSSADLMAGLEAQQAQAQQATGRRHTLSDIRQALLVRSRQQHGHAVHLSQEDHDTFELLGMLYTEIAREVREDTASADLLAQLQIPLLRVALQDRAFFVRSAHPARQLLNSVAEAGANWLGEDERDPQLELQLKRAVDHVVEHYRGDASVFTTANQTLQEHLHGMARKAEVSERRHVEAARGRERLELSKRRAQAVLEEIVRDRPLPRFFHTLLGQAWADVLTLTLLRNGEDSAEWRQQRADTESVVTAACGGESVPAGLEQRVEHALGLVGYHGEDASVIARRLTSGVDTGQDDAASRTELAVKLKARARLGEQAASAKPTAPERTAEEEACYQQLRTLPFGTWFEFVTNQQGDFVRRRLAWFSPLTEHALFVNQRGQRVDEQSLDSMARMMARGQARVVTVARGRLIDRAWQATLNVLRSFTQRHKSDAEATP